MVAFALQADASIGAVALGACGGRSPGVRGRMTPAAALARLLEGTGCTFRAVGGRDFQVVRARPEPPSSPPLVATPRPPVQAEAAPEAPRLLDEIILTAPKLSGAADHLPYPLTIVPGAELESARIRGAADLALRTAGLTVTNLGPGRNKIFLRGMSDGAFTGRTQSTVGIYLDDTRITFDAPDPDLLLTDIEQVEVLRGPQGALYGSGSIGGIYRIVTHKPELDRVDASIAVSGAATRSGAPGGSLEAMLNLPLARDRAALRLVAYGETRGGYIDNPRLGLDDIDRTRRAGVRAALKLRLSDQWSATVSVVRQGIASDDTQYVDGSAGRLGRTTAIREPHDNDFMSGALVVEGAGGWGRLRSSTAVLRHALSSRYDASTALPRFGVPAGPGAFDEDERKETVVEELSLTSPAGRRLQWLAGLFLASGQEELNSAVAAASGAALYGEVRRDDLSERAVYGEATYAFGPRFKLTAGLRAFGSSRATRSTAGPTGRVQTVQGEAASRGVAPKVVAEVQATDDLLVYAEAAEGYRPAGLSTGGLPGELVTGGPPIRAYGADELWNYESGVKATVLDGRVKLRAAVYQVVWRNLQSDQILPSGLTYTANVGDARNRGFEVEAALRLGRRLTVQANLSANEPQLHRLKGAPAGQFEEAPLPAVAKLTAGGSATFEQPLSPGLALILSAAGQHVGGSNLTFDPQTAEEMGDYTTLRLSAGVSARGWRAGIYVDNPANGSGDTFGYGNPFSFRTTAQRTPQQPLTVGFTFALHR